MSLISQYVKPKFKSKLKPKIGVIALSTDYTIEKDINTLCQNIPVNIFVNRIANYNPLTKENLLKMYDQLETVAKNILPNERINTIAYACTSGTIAIGKDKIKKKIQLAKPGCYVTTPITSAIKALNEMKIKKIAIFTPYPKSLNDTVIDYFIREQFEVLSFASFNLNSDIEIGKIDPDYLLEVLTKMDTSKAEALFISCTALPAIEILDQLESQIKKIVLSSNQTLLWDSIRSVGFNSPIKGYGKLLRK